MQNSPFFSIVTATYNASEVLPRLLASLSEQTFRDFELIIQDGASNDNTLSVIKDWKGRLPHISLASAKDLGIYDAWNKALLRIQGRWVLFLGADDLLADRYVLENASHILQALPESISFAGGELILLDRTGMEFRKLTTETKNIVDRFSKGMPVPHPALFHKSVIFKKHLFDITFKIAGDYELLVRTWKKAEQCHALHFIITHMYLGGCSSLPSNAGIIQLESDKIIKKYFFRQYILRISKRFLSSLLASLKNIIIGIKLLELTYTIKRNKESFFKKKKYKNKI